MKNKILKIFILILFVFYVTAQDDDEKEQEFRKTPPEMRLSNCITGYPLHSVGIKVYTKNFLEFQTNRLRKQNKWILAELGSSECKSCCKYETFYKNLEEKFLQTNKYLSDPLDVVFVRIDIQEHFWILPHYQSDRVPFLVLFEQDVDDPYEYNQYLDYKRIMRWIQNCHKPIRVFETAEQVEKFMNRDVKDLEKKVIRTVKVLGLFYDAEEMAEDIDNFHIAAEQQRQIGEIQFAICTVPEEVKKLVEKYENDWFAEYSFSTVLIKKKAGYFDIIDLSLQSDLLQNIIQRHTLRLFGEITHKNYNLYYNSGLPNVVVLLDTVNEYQTMRDLCRMFEKVAAFFIDEVNFMWGDGLFNQDRLVHLGFYYFPLYQLLRLPAIAFDFKSHDKELVYPQDWNVTAAKVKLWAEDYLAHRYDFGYLTEKYDYAHKQQKKTAIYKYLTEVPEVKNIDFEDLVMKTKKDAIVFYFNSRKHKSQFSFLNPLLIAYSFVDKVMHRFSHVQKRFSELFIKKINFFFFDQFYSELPLFIKVKDVETDGAIFFYQNEKKEFPRVFKDITKCSIGGIIKFIKEATTFPLKLPANSYIPEDQLDEYYEDLADGLQIVEDDYLYKVDL